MRITLIILLNSLFLITLYSCEKPEPTKDSPNTTPSPGIGFFFAITNIDSDYVWKYPNYIDSDYDPRKVYWISESGVTSFPTFQKYQLWGSQNRFGTVEQIDIIDTGQLVSVNLFAFIKDSFIINGEHYYIHFPNGDIDTLYYNYLRQDSNLFYNGKYINWNKGLSKLSEYEGMYLIIK